MSVMYTCLVTGSLTRNSETIFLGITISRWPSNPSRFRNNLSFIIFNINIMLKCKKIHHYHKINHFYSNYYVLRLLQKPIIIFLSVQKQGNNNKNLLIPRKV